MEWLSPSPTYTQNLEVTNQMDETLIIQASGFSGNFVDPGGVFHEHPKPLDHILLGQSRVNKAKKVCPFALY
jgi:hypothetical protein